MLAPPPPAGGVAGVPPAGAARAAPRVVDWMLGACPALEVDDAVLHRAVHVLDRALARLVVEESDMLTLAAAALVLASKYEECDCLTARYAAPRLQLDAGRVARMEWRAAAALGYRVGGGTARCWARHLGVTLTPLRRYLLDQALLDGAARALPPPALARQVREAPDRPGPWLARLRAFAQEISPSDARHLASKHGACVGGAGLVPRALRPRG